MYDLAIVINQIQRSKIDDKAMVCAAMQHYHKHLLAVGAIRAVKPSLASDLLPKKPLSKMNKTELFERARGLGITVDEDLTNKQLIELITNKEK